jgi:hypothetical protein
MPPPPAFRYDKTTAPPQQRRTITARVPAELYETIMRTVEDSGTTLDAVITSALFIAFLPPDEIDEL